MSDFASAQTSGDLFGTVLKAFGAARAGHEKAIKEGLEGCGNIILRKANEYVPVETESLKNSGRVEVTGQGFGTRVTVSYGGTSTPNYVDYAVYVHENETAHHAPPTGAKFLTRGIRETRGTCTSYLGRQFQASKSERV